MELNMKLFKILLLTVIIAFITIIISFWKADLSSAELEKKYGTPPSSFVIVNDTRVHFRDQGNKLDTLPILLIHGTGASLHTWEKCISKLDKQKRILTLDLPAYGLTGPNPKRDYSISYYVEFLNEFIKKLGITHLIIGGNSLGGMISWNYALQYPEKVNKLILIDASGFSFKSKSKPLAFTLARIPVIKNSLLYISPRFIARKSVENVYFNPELVTDTIVQRYFDLFLREGNRQAFIDRMEEAYSDVNIGNISKIYQKTLIIWGDYDQLIPLTSGHLFAQKLPNNSFVVIKNCGHVPMEEKPDETANAINNFLKT
jgi:pimeloyl-ACP methyl ester carboxylesterase